MRPPWRSIDGISMSETDRNPLAAEIALQLTDADAAGVEDGRREARVRVSPREDLAEVFDRAGAAGGDDGDVDRIRNSSGHLAVEARERPVPIHGGEKDLARAARFGFARPLDRVACRIGRAAANVHRKSVPSTLRIDRDDDGLAAVAAGERRDQLRVLQRRRVEADLVRAGIHRRRRIAFRADAAADRQRQKDALRDGVDRVRDRAAAFERRGDVENDDLIDPLDVVARGQLRGIARVTKLLELHALDDVAVADVHAGDDALRQHARATSRKLRRICRPASLDFSGWNCTPKTLSRSTTAANVSACLVSATHASVTGAANECVKYTCAPSSKARSSAV